MVSLNSEQLWVDKVIQGRSACRKNDFLRIKTVYTSLRRGLVIAFTVNLLLNVNQTWDDSLPLKVGAGIILVILSEGGTLIVRVHLTLIFLLISHRSLQNLEPILNHISPILT